MRTKYNKVKTTSRSQPPNFFSWTYISMSNPSALGVNDEYYTPKHVWEDISHLLPRDLTIWEPFKGNGASADFLRELGFEVISDDEDFFTSSPKGDIIVSNPPFSKSKAVLQRLVHFQKPFVVLLPCNKLTTQYVRDLFKASEHEFKLVVPPKRIDFVSPQAQRPSKCPFGTLYWNWRNPSMKHVSSLHFL
jgi:hypothetical protein